MLFGAERDDRTRNTELANGSETLPTLRANIDAITAAAARLGDCRLIVIDPVSA
jgi:hypothetical protein